jgi:cation diffusion facilitator CzcD-associated flavoprotein CzcO
MFDGETEVVIIGAGPYGLALSAYLRGLEVEHRIFGIPMESWLTKMPKGMFLKSYGFASNLYDPNDAFTLERFCVSNSLPYDDWAILVGLKTFCDYGLAFQKSFVPNVDERQVVAIAHTTSGYLLRLADGEQVRARKVVCAVGLGHFHHTPHAFDGLPRELVTHSSQHHILDDFKGRNVIIVGGGASAVDLAALLNQVGAVVRVVTRRSYIPFGTEVHLPRTLWDEIRAPMSGLGPGWRSRMSTDAPLLFHMLPQWFRMEAVRRHLGPSPGWYLRDQVEGQIPFLTNASSVSAVAANKGVRLRVRRNDGSEQELVADHVISATGYKVDLARLTFLGDLACQIRQVEGTPVLTSRFESSVPGLHFTGVAAANSFGPLLRFAFGARFAARRISQNLRTVYWGARATPPRRRHIRLEKVNPW